MKRILFIDDSEDELKELQRVLQPDRILWDMTFMSSPRAALGLMAAGERFDLVASEIDMPEMNGIDFLRVAGQEQPQMVRMALSGPVDNRSLARASNIVHQFISKPCSPHTLRVLITRALRVRDHLKESPLRQKLHELGSLPALPLVYQEVMRQMSSSDCSIGQIGKTIEKDAGLSAKLLQVVNSAGVGLRREVTNIVQAAALLGLDRLRALVLVAEVFSSVQLRAMPRGFSLDDLWQHSLKVGEYAKSIAASEEVEAKIIDDSFTAGLLHDIGLIVLAKSMPAALSQTLLYAREKKKTLFEAEKDMLGATHAEAGGYLLELWGLPDAIVDAITFHDFPSGMPEENYPSAVPEHGFTALTAVHVANYFCEDESNAKHGQAKTELDLFFLDRLKFGERLETWWESCQKPVE